MGIPSLAVNVGVLALVVLWMGLVLSLVVLILGLLHNVQRLHDVLSLGFVLRLDLLDKLFRLRCRVECSLIHILVLQALRGIESRRTCRSSQRRDVTLLTRSSRVSGSFGNWRSRSLFGRARVRVKSSW